MEVLSLFGFECVWMEEMTFRDQVELMRGAKSLIGPHGAVGLHALCGFTTLKVIATELIMTERLAPSFRDKAAKEWGT